MIATKRKKAMCCSLTASTRLMPANSRSTLTSPLRKASKPGKRRRVSITWKATHSRCAMPCPIKTGPRTLRADWSPAQLLSFGSGASRVDTWLLPQGTDPVTLALIEDDKDEFHSDDASGGGLSFYGRPCWRHESRGYSARSTE